jgi:uncharacterized membrane protein YkvA (DUF1232 family)
MPTSRLSEMAREREADRKAGRPERGLFTGRGPDPRDREDRRNETRRRRLAERGETQEMAATDGRDHDDDDDFEDEPRSRRSRPRTGAKRTVLQAVRQIPAYIRLLIGLIGDRRVSKVDRFLVLAAVAYIVSPVDFIPDFLPFLGEVDDIFLLMMALQRLVANTGKRVLMDHWRGHPDELSDVNLAGMVSAAGFFLPPRLRRRLRKMAGR